MDYLSIDVGGTYIKYALVDRSGEIKTVHKIETPLILPDFYEKIFGLIESVQADIKGIGISLPGKIDTTRGIIYYGGSLTYLHEVPLKEQIETRFNIRCELSNDGKAAALAELWLGNLEGINNGAAIVLGTGVGGGIIINGKLLQGSRFQAGELSFLLNYEWAHQTDHLVGYEASAVGFIANATKLMGPHEVADGPKVFEVIKAGENQDVTDTFENYCQVIARIIHNLQATLDLSRVVIGGGISAQSIVTQEINKQYALLRSRTPIIEKTLGEVEIHSCHFKSEANLLGAIYQLFLQIDTELSTNRSLPYGDHKKSF